MSIHVAVAVIKNQHNEVLISLRANDAHQGGMWEFPGGKLEAGESVFDALHREILEELNIAILKATPLKILEHNYVDKSVILDVWLVESYTGTPEGAEGQKIKWQSIDKLNADEFPMANHSIIQSLKLPDKYMITGAFKNHEDFMQHLESSLNKGIRLVQLRCKDKSSDEYMELAKKGQSICNAHNAILLLNTKLDSLYELNANGLHLSSERLHSLSARPNVSVLSVSCHTVEDIEQANRLNADIILLSPVKETKSHPGVEGIGWGNFSQIIKSTNIPVYALGGMSTEDLADAKRAGAQGIAAISSLWNSL